MTDETPKPTDPTDCADPNIFLPDAHAEVVADRLPHPTMYPRPPDRQREPCIQVNDTLYQLPTYSAFVLPFPEATDHKDLPPPEMLKDEGRFVVNLLLDALSDSVIAYNITDGRYVAYDVHAFQERLENHAIKFCRDIE